jgi:hypothetical protein
MKSAIPDVHPYTVTQVVRFGLSVALAMFCLRTAVRGTSGVEG